MIIYFSFQFLKNCLKCIWNLVKCKYVCSIYTVKFFSTIMIPHFIPYMLTLLAAYKTIVFKKSFKLKRHVGNLITRLKIIHLNISTFFVIEKVFKNHTTKISDKVLVIESRITKLNYSNWFWFKPKRWYEHYKKKKTHVESFPEWLYIYN